MVRGTCLHKINVLVLKLPANILRCSSQPCCLKNDNRFKYLHSCRGVQFFQSISCLKLCPMVWKNCPCLGFCSLFFSMIHCYCPTVYIKGCAGGCVYLVYLLQPVSKRMFCRRIELIHDENRQRKGSCLYVLHILYLILFC